MNAQKSGRATLADAVGCTDSQANESKMNKSTALTDQCDRVQLVVEHAIARGWITATLKGREQLREAIRIALDSKIAAGGSGKTMPQEDRELTAQEALALKKATGQDRSRTVRFALGEGSKGEFINDDEFTYDALLRVHGDFETREAKHAYLAAVCEVLNEHEDRIPHRAPDRPSSGVDGWKECE